MKIEGKWIFRGLIVAGLIYLVGMIPGSYRPVLHPVSKGKPTITVDVDSPAERTVPWRAAGQVETACRAPILLRPVMGPASKAEVLLRFQNSIVADITVPCPKES